MKKILRTALSVIALVGLMTVGASAAEITVGTENADQTDLATAFSNAEDGDTIKLITEIDATTADVSVSNRVTLDLNGQELKLANTEEGQISVATTGDLTLMDSTADPITGVGTGKIYSETGTSYAVIDVAGTFTMESGYIYTSFETDPENDGNFAIVVKGDGVDDNDVASVTIKNGKIEAGWYAVSGNGSKDYTSITINGGELISTADYAIYHPQIGTLDINGGTINGYNGGVAVNDGTVNITDVTILSMGTGDTGDYSDGTSGMPNAAIVLNARYGDVTANVSNTTLKAMGDAVTIVSGTTYNVALTTNNMTYEVYNATGLATAVALGGTVKLGANITFDAETTASGVTIAQDTTLDLNGCTLTVSPVSSQPTDATDVRNIYVDTAATLTITDSQTGGELVTSSTAESGRGAIDVAGTVTVTGGTVDRILAIENGAVTVDGGTVTEISNHNLMDGHTVITVNSGNVGSIYSTYMAKAYNHDVVVNGGSVGGITLKSSVWAYNGGETNIPASVVPTLTVSGSATVDAITIDVYEDLSTYELTLNDLFNFAGCADATTFTYDSTIYTITDGVAAVYVAPSTGGGSVTVVTPSTSTTTDTTTNDDGSVTGTVSASSSSTVNGTTTATVADSKVESAIETAVEAADGEDAHLEIAVESKSSTTTVAAQISSESAQAIADSDVASLTISSDLGTVEIPSDALSEIASQATGSDIVIAIDPTVALTDEQSTVVGDSLVVGLSITSGGETIGSFGGQKITVSLPYALKDGESAKNIVVWYVADDGSITAMPTSYDETTGLVTFTTTHFSVYLVAHDSNPFTDVDTDDYFYFPVMWAVENDITSGLTDTTFAPDTACTRAQAVTFLWNAAGKPVVTGAVNPFTDVTEGAWYYDAVLWAVDQGITAGTTETTFEPNATCTRAQIVTFLWNNAGKPALGSATSFVDVTAGAWYEDAILWAVYEDITSGTGNGAFSPNADCTRGQIVTFMYKDMAE